MGSAQSTPVAGAEIREKVIAQLAAVRLEALSDREHDLKKGYVYLDNDGEMPPAYSQERSLTVSVKGVEQWEQELLEDPKNRLALGALTSNPLNAIVGQKTATFDDLQNFSIKIPFEGAPIPNQRSSGRCWLFAATNVFRVAIMKKHNLSSFELSQAYLFFWDKLEKANWFLEQILETTDSKDDDRLFQQLLQSPVGDGGQWDMVANLVAKYGLVPQTLYPDSYHAENSSAMSGILTTKLREDALILRKLASNKTSSSKGSIASAKSKMMQEVHRILTLMLGPPPKPSETFKWEYYDSDNKYHTVNKTPMEFASELSTPSLTRSIGGADVNKMFSLVHDPRNPFNKLLTVSRLGNVIGGRPITYVNVEIETLKTAAITMLKAGLPVFFGSDVGKYLDGKKGVMDIRNFDYDLAFNIRLSMSKSQRLITHESQMTHAMVLTGVHIEKGKSIRWRVMNSWGDTAGDKGYYLMTDEWMDEFVYQVVVAPAFVDKEIRDVLTTDPIVLPLWDPMGALA